MGDPGIFAPSQDIVQSLCEKYFMGEDAEKGLEFASSDWRQETQLLKVRNAPGGEIVPLSGAYWGCHWAGIRTRILDQIGIGAHVLGLTNKKMVIRYWRNAAKICRMMGLDPTYTVFRQSCTLELIARHMPAQLKDKRISALIIGDGIGVLSALFKSVFPDSTVVMVDLGKSLLYQAYYVGKAHPEASHKLASDVDRPDDVDFVYCPTEDLEALDNFRFDVAVNINSMQEMNRQTIARYFSFLRNHLNADNLFYCCNRVRREMVGGEVSEFLNYPWRTDDSYLVDGGCPWQRFFLSRRPARNGPRLFGLRTPFVSYFDGPIMHRLAVLAGEQQTPAR